MCTKTSLARDTNAITIVLHGRAGFRPRGLQLRPCPGSLTGKGTKLVGIKTVGYPYRQTEFSLYDRCYNRLFTVHRGEHCGVRLLS